MNLTTIIRPTHIRHGKLASSYEITQTDGQRSHRLEIIAHSKAEALQNATRHFYGQDITEGSSIMGWTDCDGPDLGEPEAA